MGTGRLRLARELPQKRRPPEVPALIIGSADAIGWQILIYKVDLDLHCGCRLIQPYEAEFLLHLGICDNFFDASAFHVFDLRKTER